jgi:hypothetical protein
MTDDPCRKEVKKMINRVSKLATPVVIAVASLAFVLSPTVGLANTPAEAKAHQAQAVRQPVRRSIYFQHSLAKTENQGRTLERVIRDRHNWYQMFE